MSNGRRLFREYAKSKGIDAVEFVSLIPEWYNNDVLTVKDSQGKQHNCTINYKDLIHWLIKNKHINI